MKLLSELRDWHAASGALAFNVLRLTAAVPAGNTLTIGNRIYECDDQVASAVATGHVRVPVFNGHANATLNFDDSQNVADGNTVTVGTKVYTFKTTLANVDGYVAIGPTLERSIYNLVAAMNVGNADLYEPPANYGALNDVGEGAGVAYAAAMTPNAAGIEAMYGGDFDLQIAHRAGGTAGNSIALAETLVGSGAWAEGNQVDAVATPTADQFATALVTALNRDPGGPVWAERLSATEVLVWSRRPGDVRSVCEAAFTQGGNGWDQATLGGGMPAQDALRAVCGVVRTPTALEITRQRLHFVFGFEPHGVVLQVRSSAGVPVAFDGVVTLSGRRVTVTAATVALAAGQVFQVLVFQ